MVGDLVRQRPDELARPVHSAFGKMLLTFPNLDQGDRRSFTA